jgi:hypothetical protein
MAKTHNKALQLTVKSVAIFAKQKIHATFACR